VAAWLQRNLRIRQFADEERDLPELAVAAAGLAGVAAIIASSVPMWNQILRYARGR
jgi:hypothetical protein